MVCALFISVGMNETRDFSERISWQLFLQVSRTPIISIGDGNQRSAGLASVPGLKDGSSQTCSETSDLAQILRRSGEPVAVKQEKPYHEEEESMIREKPII